MFDKVLIANRGEVALRIMRACKEMGIKTVAVYSTEDADTYPVRYADEKVCIGPAPANKSYLVMPSIIAAAVNTGCQAIHPGYGFLAENSDFARACADNDLVFIGPSPECDVYLEKLVLRPRHVEVQILADKHGNRISLCERDCSLQRRHQKLLEEAPSPALTEEIRRAMGVAAVKAVRATGYENAGTIEFLLDTDGKFYFMEMNTRVQVEHPVSEQITGTDIIKEQLRIASGEPISCIERAPFTPFGHAMEFRINAEDPEHDFRPCPGNITRFEVPGGPGVRVETYIKQGDRISPYYDSMVAKLIVWGIDRDECIARGKRALSEFCIEGIKTTIPFHLEVLEKEAFVEGRVYTDFIETEMGDE